MEKYRIKEIIINGIKYYKLQKRILRSFWVNVRLPAYYNYSYNINPKYNILYWEGSDDETVTFLKVKREPGIITTVIPKTSDIESIKKLKNWLTKEKDSSSVIAGYILQHKDYRTEKNDIGIAYIVRCVDSIEIMMDRTDYYFLDASIIDQEYYVGYKNSKYAIEEEKNSNIAHKYFNLRKEQAIKHQEDSLARSSYIR